MRAVWILVILSQATAETADCVDDTAVTARCLRPLLDVWEAIRESETNSRDLLFPVPFYSKKAIHRLCVYYISSMDSCAKDSAELNCPNNPLKLFVDSHLKFFCGEFGPAYLDNYSCISGALSKLQRCRSHILGVPNPIQSSGKCRGVSEFSDCVETELKAECGEMALALLRRSLEELGCLKGSVEDQIILQQANSSKVLNDLYRRDYFKTAQETEPNTITSKPVRGTEDYPKMPEIAFHEDAQNSSTDTVTDESSTAINSNVSLEEELASSELPSTKAAITSTAAFDPATVSPNKALAKGLPPQQLAVGGREDSMSSEDEEVETTEPLLTTTAHPPYCIPRRDFFAITGCHRNLMNSLSELSRDSPGSDSVRFPLFNVSLEAVVSLCDELRDARKCMNGLDKLCQHPLLAFLGKQLAATCQLLKMRDFDVDYSCIQRKLTEREDCIVFLNGTLDPSEDQCVGHEQFLSCMKTELEQVCGEESFNSVVTMLRGYGCNVSDDIVAASTVAARNATTTLGTTVSTTSQRSTRPTPMATTAKATSSPVVKKAAKSQEFDVEASGEAPSEDDNILPTVIVSGRKNGVMSESDTAGDVDDDDAGEESSSASTLAGENADLDGEASFKAVAPGSSPSPGFEEEEESLENDDPLFNYTLSSNCTRGMRNQARVCTAPLMRTWSALRATWPHLSEVSFPVYKYSRVELLELCDSYANVFLCADVDHIRVCIMDELVRFAKDHLGYICSPQNIQRFMTHYDCIMEQEALGRGSCRSHIMGEAFPGRDEHKCKGVMAYRACLAPHLKRHCRPGALKEFDASVQQFGCKIKHV